MQVSFRLLRTGALFGAALILTSCGLFGGQVDMELSPAMKQKCAPVGIVAYTGELTRFEGASREASAVEFRATLGKLDVQCRDSADGQGLFADINFDISVIKGPASKSNSVEIPFFISVSRGNEAVLEKNLYTSQHTFGSDNWSAYRENVTAYVPLGPDGELMNYEVLIGLQLSKDEFQYNLAR